MHNKREYVQLQWRRVVLLLGVGVALSLLFVVFSLGAWIFGEPKYLSSDAFKFSLLVIATAGPYYAFFWIIRGIVLWGISKTSEV